MQERGLFLGDDLEHDEEIKYSAVRRDTDNSKYKSFTNVPSSTHHVDSFNRTVNIDPKDSLACSSTMVQNNFYTNVTNYCFRCLAVSTLQLCLLIYLLQKVWVHIFSKREPVHFMFLSARRSLGTVLAFVMKIFYQFFGSLGALLDFFLF